MPSLGYNVGGWRPTGAARIRAGIFGIAFVEEQWECRDGTRQWRKCDQFCAPVNVSKLREPDAV